MFRLYFVDFVIYPVHRVVLLIWYTLLFTSPNFCLKGSSCCFAKNTAKLISINCHLWLSALLLVFLVCASFDWETVGLVWSKLDPEIIFVIFQVEVANYYFTLAGLTHCEGSIWYLSSCYVRTFKLIYSCMCIKFLFSCYVLCILKLIFSYILCSIFKFFRMFYFRLGMQFKSSYLFLSSCYVCIY